MPNITNLTPPRVPLVDENGFITREWYRFLFNQFLLTGGGSSDISITDLSVAPNESVQLLAQINELQKQLDALKLQVYPQLGSMAPLQQDNLPWVTFDTTPQSLPVNIGTLAWDGGTTLGLQATANVLMRVGESEFVYVKASSNIVKGQLCYHTGSVGSSGVITVAPTPLALSDPNQIVGVAAENIALNSFGLIQISGDLRGFNTTGSSVGETWADGDPLYYNPSFVGSFTKVKPTAPNQKTYIGEVINAGSGASGSINIRIVPGSVLGGTDSNVQITSLTNGDILQYVSANNRWENKALSATGVVTSFSAGTTGFTPNTPTTGAVVLGGTLGIANGGTGYTTAENAFNALAPTTTRGDLIYRTASTNARLPVGTSGQVLISTGVDPIWGQVSLTAGVTGTLPIANGGTGQTTASAAFNALAPTTTRGDLIYRTGSTNARLPVGTNGQVLISTGVDPIWGQVSLTAGVTGTLPIANGGTGQTTASAAFDALAPTTTRGDMIYRTGSTNARLPVGTSGQILMSSGLDPIWGQISAGTGININNTGSGGTITISNGMGGGAPVTKTANFTVAAGETWIINNKSGSSCVVTLPTASSNTGRMLSFVNYQAQTLVSASSNVVPLGGGAAGTAILDAVVGNWATMVSDGTNWIIMQDAPNNALLIE